MKIWEVEHGLSASLPPPPPLLQEVLVTATVVLKHIASMISDSQDVPPSRAVLALVDMFCYHVYL